MNLLKKFGLGTKEKYVLGLAKNPSCATKSNQILVPQAAQLIGGCPYSTDLYFCKPEKLAGESQLKCLPVEKSDQREIAL